MAVLAAETGPSRSQTSQLLNYLTNKMEPERLVFGLGPAWVMAIAAVLNVAVVVVLAIINFRYMRSAARQADATTKQADAATRQALAAFENINLLKEQVRDLASLKLTETMIDLRRMCFSLEWWSPKLEPSWGSLPSVFDGGLPDNWPSIVHLVERTVPNQKENLANIERHIRNAEMLIRDQLARSPNYRQTDVLRVAACDLNEALGPLRAVLLELENQRRRGAGPSQG